MDVVLKACLWKETLLFLPEQLKLAETIKTEVFLKKSPSSSKTRSFNTKPNKPANTYKLLKHRPLRPETPRMDSRPLQVDTDLTLNQLLLTNICSSVAVRRRLPEATCVSRTRNFSSNTSKTLQFMTFLSV